MSASSTRPSQSVLLCSSASTRNSAVAVSSTGGPLHHPRLDAMLRAMPQASPSIQHAPQVRFKRVCQSPANRVSCPVICHHGVHPDRSFAKSRVLQPPICLEFVLCYAKRSAFFRSQTINSYATSNGLIPLLPVCPSRIATGSTTAANSSAVPLA